MTFFQRLTGWSAKCNNSDLTPDLPESDLLSDMMPGAVEQNEKTHQVLARLDASSKVEAERHRKPWTEEIWMERLKKMAASIPDFGTKIDIEKLSSSVSAKNKMGILGDGKVYATPADTILGFGWCTPPFL